MATNTTNTFTNHTGNGTEVNFSISFSYILTSDIDVTVAGVTKTLGTHYTISGSTVTFTSGNVPANGAAIKFQRDTSISTKAVDFQDGSVLTEQDLDNNTNQVLFAQQEITDKLNGIEDGATADQTDAEIRTAVENASDSNVFTDADHSKLNGIEAGATADQTNAEIRAAVEAASDSNVFTDADHSKLNAIEAGATADQTISEIKSLIASSPLDASHLAANSVDSAELVDGSVDNSHLSNDCVAGVNILDDSINSEHYVNGSIDEAHIANNAVTTTKIADAELKTLAGMQSGTASKLADSTALTSDIADLNQLDGMAKQTTITDDDTKFPTSGAVVDYVSGQLDDIGGFESIANELSFPNTQAPNGVSISIADAAGLVVNGSGVSTTGRTLNGTTVTINNIPSNFHSSTVATGVRFIVTSTGSGQIYNYHKATLAESDLVGLSGQINDFSERYRVGSTNPTSNNDAGDLFFNTSTQKLLVYNGTSGAWEEAQSIGNFFISTLSPAFDGSTTDFTITNAPANAQQILLIIEGVLQKPNSGTSISSSDEGFVLSGSTVKLAVAPAVGASYHAVVMGSTVNIGTPSNNTVTSAILQNGSVINSKLGADAVDGSKIADDSINSEHYVDASIDHAHLSNDCVDGDNIADDSINSEHYVDGSIDTAHIADDAVDASKLANSINSAIAANTAKDLTALNASNLTSGTVPDARFPATLPAVSGANLTNLPASGKPINLVINGAFRVAQRGVSSTSDGYHTVDRFYHDSANNDESPTFAQVDVNSSDAGENPYAKGFTKAFKITNGNQTSGAQTNSYARVSTVLEAGELRNSGWNYTSSSSKITLSFYVKASVAQNYYGMMFTQDGTPQSMSFETGTLTANTWTKVTVTVGGATNIQFDDNFKQGFYIYWWAYNGTDYTASSGNNFGSFGTYNSSARTPDNTSTWWTTNDATFELTGILLEVGETASDYPHESYEETLRRCQRYFQVLVHRKSGDGGVYFGGGYMYDHYRAYLPITYYVEMRTAPSFQFTSGSSYYSLHRNGVGDNFDGWNTAIGGDNKHVAIQAQSGLSGTGGQMGGFWSNATGAKISFEAEL